MRGSQGLHSEALAMHNTTQRSFALRSSVPRHAMPCHAMPCHAMPCYTMPCHATPCYAMLCHATLCYAMLRYPTLCHAILRYDMQHVVLPQAHARHAANFRSRSATPYHIVVTAHTRSAQRISARLCFQAPLHRPCP